jgi:Rrf2 family transcriptional regulator, iron-sulfur cluster assembly transcription factor
MRLHLTRQSGLAIRALKVLADGQRRTAAELADAIATSPGYVPQVLGHLIRAGWIVSEAGPRGGYRLTVDPGEPSLLEVIEAMEGPIDSGRCVVDTAARCSDETACEVHDAWHAARQVLTDGLRRSVICPLTPDVGGSNGSGSAPTVVPPTQGTPS